MKAQDYLHPEKFVTTFDNMPCHVESGRAQEKYNEGLKTGSNAEYIYLRPVHDLHAWGAQMKDGSYVTAYETIGLHAHTKELLQGFLDSGVEIVISAYDGQGKWSRSLITKSRDIVPLPKSHRAY